MDLFQKFIRGALCLVIFWAGHSLYAQSEARFFPDYPLAKGVSAPFAGWVGNRLVVAGGCNFPETPAAEGGKKRFYSDVYAVGGAQDTSWKTLPALLVPIAYGASVTTKEGLVCIGGQNEKGSSNQVFLLQADGRVKHLPPLPVAMDNGGAALCGTSVYVTGGNQADEGKALFALDLTAPVSWRRLADYPGYRRIQPVVLSVSDALFLAGGYDFDAERKICTLSSDILRYDPATDTWSCLDVLPAGFEGEDRCLVGGSGVTKEGYLILTGGVDYSVFKQAMEGRGPSDYMRRPVDWYRFNDDLLIYDLSIRSWQVIPDVQGMDRAGGVLLEREGILYMVCGELKPGIRSPKISVVSLDDLCGLK